MERKERWQVEGAPGHVAHRRTKYQCWKRAGSATARLGLQRISSNAHGHLSKEARCAKAQEFKERRQCMGVQVSVAPIGELLLAEVSLVRPLRQSASASPQREVLEPYRGKSPGRPSRSGGAIPTRTEARGTLCQVALAVRAPNYTWPDGCRTTNCAGVVVDKRVEYAVT